MPRLRPATIHDAPQIADIYAPWVRETAISFELEAPGPEEMARRIESLATDHPWLVVEEDGRLLGYAYATAFRLRPAYRWSVETTVYLDREHTGRGVGRSLYVALLELATAWGYANAFAGIALPNPASESLHASVDFTPIGVFPRAGHKFGRWHDVGWWHRRLSPADPPLEPSPPSPELVAELLSTL